MIIVSLVILVAASIIGMKVIGNPDISIEALNAAVQTPESLKVFLASLSKEQLVKINAWNLLLFRCYGIYVFYRNPLSSRNVFQKQKSFYFIFHWFKRFIQQKVL